METLSARVVSEPLRINLIVNSKWEGLSKDVKILSQELGELGHRVHVIAVDLKRKKGGIRTADINLHLGQVYPKYLSCATKQYLLPNPECCRCKEDLLYQCDLILCKTEHAMRIFSSMELNVFFLNFTSFDHFDSQISKDYTHPLHSRGTSGYKGTEQTLAVWKKRPDFPTISFLESKKKQNYIQYYSLDNVDHRAGFLPYVIFKEIQNACGIHICVSKCEGFGHYINEAMSTGAIVMTTDGPPMNEFICDSHQLAKVKSQKKIWFGQEFTIDEKDLEQKIEAVLQLSEEECREIGRRNRKAFLERDEDFRKNLKELFGFVRGSYDVDALKGVISN